VGDQTRVINSSSSFGWGLKSFVRQQGAWMHHETYAAKSEFGEFRGCRWHSYFTKRHTCMSVTQCLGAFEVLLSTYGALEMVQALTLT